MQIEQPQKTNFKDIETLLEQNRELFLSNLITFPIQASVIKQEFENFFATYAPNFADFFESGNVQQNVDMNELKLLLEKEILEPTLQKAQRTLQDKFIEDAKRFVDKATLKRRFLSEKALLMLYDKDMDLLKFPSIFYWIMEKIDQYSEEKEYSGIPKKAELITLNAKFIQFFVIKVIEKAFLSFEFHSNFMEDQDKIQNLMTRVIISKFKSQHNETYDWLANRLDGVSSECKKEQLTEISLNFSQQIQEQCQIQSFQNEYEEIALSRFREELKNSIGFELNELFLNIQEQSILNNVRIKIKDEIAKKGKTLDANKIEEKQKNWFQSLLSDFVMRNVPPFSVFKSKEIRNMSLFMLQMSNLEFDEKEEFDFFQEYLKATRNKQFSDVFLSETENFTLSIHNNFNIQLELLDSWGTFLTNEKAVRDKQKNLINQWRTAVDPFQNFYICFSLIMDANRIEKRGGNLIHIGKQSAKMRNLLRKILRSFSYLDFFNRNWQICNWFEHVLEAIFFSKQIGEPLFIKELPQFKDFLNPQTIEQDANDEIIGKIRKQEIKEFPLILPPDKIPDVKEQPKLILEKISSPNIISRAVTLCISGFLSENSENKKLWEHLLTWIPNQEIQAITWNSSSTEQFMQQIVDLVTKSIATSTSVNQQAGIAYFLLNAFQAKPYSDAKKKAELTGQQLAHILASGMVFANNAINLIGFSLGTEVIYECIEELGRLGATNIIHDVLLLGGTVNSKRFQGKSFNQVNGRIITTFSTNDGIINYFTQMTISGIGQNPIGAKKLENVSKKICSYNVSKVVNAHQEYRTNLKKVLEEINYNLDQDSIFESN